MKTKSFFLSPADYLGLYRVSKVRNQSSENYFLFQKYQGNFLVKFLLSHGLNFEGKKVLDLGSGPGGYSAAIGEVGARVISVDLTPLYQDEKVLAVSSDAMKLPFEDGSFDIIVCASLIEHVEAPQDLLKEILRVLRNDGTVYLSFPPFYSPVGGHQFAPFHLLGEKNAVKLARKFRPHVMHSTVSFGDSASPDLYRHAFGNWGLYVLTIRRVQNLLMLLPVQVLERSTRWLPIDFSGVPYLGEFLTWHVQFLFGKKR